jgi:hypothetical protein
MRKRGGGGGGRKRRWRRLQGGRAGLFQGRRLGRGKGGGLERAQPCLKGRNRKKIKEDHKN